MTETKLVRPKDIIVSLTSHPARMPVAHMALRSLLTQTFKPGKVILWLSEEDFPNREADLPKRVLLLKSSGVSIEWCHDIKSYGKLIPTLTNYPEHIIVTADDDIFYKNTWLKQLVMAYCNAPSFIHCHRARRLFFNKDTTVRRYHKWPVIKKRIPVSHKNFFNGCGGVLYPPKCLHEDVLNEELFMSLCPTGDDIWFWGMSVLNHVKTKVLPKIDFNLTLTPNSQDCALWLQNCRDKNDKMLDALFTHYPEILDIVRKD